MELQRVGIKCFVANPASVHLSEFIPIFHAWIQKQIMEDHLMIDTHDYSHIHNGPGILLVAHEANLSIDMADGRPGLFYYRKHPSVGHFENGLTSIVRFTLQACRILENEFEGRLRFRTDELLVVANDRLLAPNNEQTLAALTPSLNVVFNRVLAGTDYTLTRAAENPKERFAVRVETAESASVETLLHRLRS